MISHRNVIANVLQISTFEKPDRDSLKDLGIQSDYTDVILGLLPQSHCYGLVMMCHAGPYRGDQVIVLPKFEMRSYLDAIQRFKIITLYLVSLLLEFGWPSFDVLLTIPSIRCLRSSLL